MSTCKADYKLSEGNRNENKLMEQAEDTEKYYIEVIMQEKIKLYLGYVGKHSLLWGGLG